jgi:hypothetical protein
VLVELHGLARERAEDPLAARVAGGAVLEELERVAPVIPSDSIRTRWLSAFSIDRCMLRKRDGHRSGW